MTPTRFLAVTLGLLSPLLHLGAHAADFTVSSTDIAPGQTLAPAQVFQGFGCTGGNLAPQLSWHGAPAGTKSYAITLYDPDAPTGSGWWHWSVFNLPATTSSLPAGTTAATLPAGAVQGRNDYGDSAYGGACPPPGDKVHHYQLTVWALSVDKLPLDRQAEGLLLLDRRDPLAARVQQVLLLDPGADWSVAKVASKLHVGASTLRRQLALEQRHFRAILEDVRLGLALQELQSGILSITDIAAACGYASPSRFAARFRQHYGLSPRDLRATL